MTFTEFKTIRSSTIYSKLQLLLDSLTVQNLAEVMEYLFPNTPGDKILAKNLLDASDTVTETDVLGLAVKLSELYREFKYMKVYKQRVNGSAKYDYLQSEYIYFVYAGTEQVFIPEIVLELWHTN